MLVEPMTTEQIELVRSTWETMKPRARQFTDLLYEELFTAEPQLRLLFEGIMDEQHLKLSKSIDRAVEVMHDPTDMDREFRALGGRHQGYGVKPYHYEAMGLAFDKAVERAMGDAHNEAIREAWAAFYDQLQGSMQRGAN